MKKDYNDINTPEELIEQVSAFGLSIDQDDRNRAADIIGNAAVGHLAEIANSDKSRTFYFIAFSVWHWEQAVSFYNKYSHPCRDEYRGLKDKNKELEHKIEVLTYRNDEYEKQFTDIENEKAELKQKEAIIHGKYKDLQLEVFELKAKLYDLMMAGA